MFLKLDTLGRDYVIRLKTNRKLLYHNKWTMAAQLRDRRKHQAVVLDKTSGIPSTLP